MVYTRTAAVALSLLAQGVLGNLNIGQPYYPCLDQPCLDGLICRDNGLCTFPLPHELFRRVAAPAPIPAPGDYSVDGKCGPANGGLICNPNSPNYAGGCCSVSPFTPPFCSDAYW